VRLLGNGRSELCNGDAEKDAGTQDDQLPNQGAVRA